MATINKMCECVKCKKSTLHIINTPNHILHLLLTIVTVGFWLLVWICQKNTTPQCSQCGTDKASWWDDIMNTEIGAGYKNNAGYKLAKKIRGVK
jgi:hypothetical protein